MNAYIGDDAKEKLWDELSRDVDESRLVVVHLTKGDRGFGFNIRGGIDHPHVGSDPGIFVTTVRADSVAGQDGRLEAGDRILAINAIRLDDVTHDVAVNEFRRADDSISLLVEKNAEAHILTCEIPNSPEVEVEVRESEVEPEVEVPEVEVPDGPSNPDVSLLRQFYESKLGALSMGLAVGSIAVFVAIRIYRATCK